MIVFGYRFSGGFEPPFLCGGAAAEPQVPDAAGPGLCVRPARRAEMPQPLPHEWLLKPRSSGGLALARGPWGLLMASYCGSRAWVPAAGSPAAGSQPSTELVVARGPSISTERFQHTLWHAFVPNWLVLRGDAVLHAACAVVDGRAFLMVGESTGGKSTLAAGLALRGVSVLADDVTRLSADAGGEGWAAWPGVPGVRLRGNSFLLPPEQRRSEPGPYGLPKLRLYPPASCAHPPVPVPVAGVLLLARARQVQPAFVRQSGLQALNPLLAAQFSQAAAAAGQNRQVFAQAVQLAAALPVWEMRYRRSAVHFEALLDSLIGFMRAAD